MYLFIYVHNILKCLFKKYIRKKNKNKRNKKHTEAEPKTITIAVIVVANASNNSQYFCLKDSKTWNEAINLKYVFHEIKCVLILCD